ncbi:MAG TPA: VOC family protein [Acidimicrobiales bacterium]|jgi:glyoxylase I family protein|nr:VOC family protein [Acidimicrobiales bacterium]HWI03773.1 VOC family protein [Acidimicrobiales bacterium]
MTITHPEQPPFVQPALHHLALTVTDLEASVAWYTQVFSISYRMEAPHAGGVGVLLSDDAWELIIVLHRHETNEEESFVETRTGLDHAGFSVPGRADLELWRSRLMMLGVEVSDEADRPLTQSPIADTPYGSVLVFRDPDNIQLELYSRPET